MKRSSRATLSIRRALIAALCAWACASPGGVARAGGDAKDAAIDRAAARPIVHLETRQGLVTVYAGSLGRYYSIASRDGALVAERISEVELRAQHPDVAQTVGSGVATIMADL